MSFANPNEPGVQPPPSAPQPAQAPTAAQSFAQDLASPQFDQQLFGYLQGQYGATEQQYAALGSQASLTGGLGPNFLTGVG